jgi:hypothetical protein
VVTARSEQPPGRLWSSAGGVVLQHRPLLVTPHPTHKADPMAAGDPALELDSEALAAVIARFLGQGSEGQMEVAGGGGHQA